jgi:uncharacterized protein (DUF697 family)
MATVMCDERVRSETAGVPDEAVAVTTCNEQIRSEMAEIQCELQAALHDLLSEIGGKLKPGERESIEAEFRQLDDVLERLKTGLIWVTLFGKTSVGKSSIANALMGDDLAGVAPDYDSTTEPTEYHKPPWMLVDVPGFMGNRVNEEIAIAEARKAHGHIFVIDGEPYGDEMELFERVHDALPETPKIVFVNKWDVAQNMMPRRDQEIVQAQIARKMGKFVRSPDDIVYGSAMRFDRDADSYTRQELPQLLDRMYEGAGTLGMVMNILDPAHRAVELGDRVRDRITEARSRVARRVISRFSTASVAGGFIPFNQLIVTPGILAGMVLSLFRIMGRPIDRKAAKAVSVELLKACGLQLGAEFAAVVVAEGILSTAYVLGPVGALLGAVGNIAGLGYYRYRRTAILGEVTLEYIRNNCSWDGLDRHEVFVRCKERAMAHYLRLQRAGED